MGKEKMSLTLTESQVREISDLQEEGYESRSEAVRALVDKGLAYDEVEAERDELRGELRSLEERLDGMDDVVGYARRRQRFAGAPIWTRLRWRIAGVPDDGRRG
jgi:Arc/MetJ-type ribon-helix-helix transcriptional regulator